MDKAIKMGIVAGILIVACSIGYYFVVFLPKKESYKQAQERKITERRQYCNQWAIDTAKNDDLQYETEEDYNFYFKQCLNEQGVNN
jgi:hypothetical protein